MERLKRRLWTMATIALAGVVIGATLISGLFQTAVYLLPSYRDDLSVWVTRVAGRPVQIGGISLVWSGAAPRLDLSDITLFSEDGAERALSARRLSLGISLWRLLTVDWRPSRVELSGLSLGLRADASGRLHMIGFDAGDDFSRADAEKWLRQLGDFRSMRLENCELVVALYSGDLLRFGLPRFEADRSPGGFEVEGQLRLPLAYGETLSFSAEVRGAVEEPDGWDGAFSAAATGLLPQPWLRGHVAPGTAAGVDALRASLEGTIARGDISELRVGLEGEGLVIVRAGDEQAIDQLQAEIVMLRRPEGWRTELHRLRIDGEDQFQGLLFFGGLANGYELGGDMRELRLDRLAPYLRYWRDLPADARQLTGLGGRIADLSGYLRHTRTEDARYTLRARIEALQVPPATQRYSVAGLSGRITASDSGGSLQLQPGALRLSLPFLATPQLELEQLSGTLEWSRRLVEDGGGWQLSVPQYAAAFQGARSSGQLTLWLPPDPAQSPELDLTAQLAVADAAALKPWMPQRWGLGLRDWLQRAIQHARVPAGSLRIRGPLRDFPFADGAAGEWSLALDVADGQLDFAPGWPALRQLQARLNFRGNGLTIEAPAADLGGNRVEAMRAEFSDFGDPAFMLAAASRGEAASYYQLLRSSPIAQQLGGLLNNTSAAGPVQVDLNLRIPLVKDLETMAQGEVRLDGVQMYYRNLDEPIRDIGGVIRFDDAGVTAENLRARFADVDFGARIEARAGTQGVVVAEVPYALDGSGQGLAEWIPLLLRPHLLGSTVFRVELPLGTTQAGLSLRSSLEGIAVRLPAPLAKEAALAVPLELQFGGGDGTADEPQALSVRYGDRLGARVLLGRERGQSLQVTGTALRLGSGEPPAEAGSGLRLAGDTADIDVDAWSAALGGAVQAGLPLVEADLHAGRWHYRGQVLRDVRARIRTVAQGWDAQLTGPGAEGGLQYRADGGARRLGGQLKHLMLELPQWLATENVKAPGTPALDPTTWPALDLAIADLYLNEGSFGAVALRSVALPGRGQQLQELRLSGGVLEGSASGEWLRESARSSAKLKFNASSGDFTEVLRSFGYAQNLSAEKAQLSGNLAWEPGAAGIDWAQTRGRLELAFQNGTLKAVEPGAGRVLGLLNFYALPRRLTLDFRDVVRSGLGFDRIIGTFSLGDGAALTEDVQIEAPSLRMELRGRVGLAARDYDQRVTVYPDVSAGATIGAALLGGPAAAAIAFIAQEVLDKPLDQLTQFSYQVTGSWDNPQVRRIESADDGPAVGDTRPKK
jgi:uncharacterized protein (TIGR02099 family)